jgi:hypothetical protein
MQLALPIEALTKQMPLPGLFLRFISVAEVAAATSLVPGIRRIRQVLTQLAAYRLEVTIKLPESASINVGNNRNQASHTIEPVNAKVVNIELLAPKKHGGRHGDKLTPCVPSNPPPRG